MKKRYLFFYLFFTLIGFKLPAQKTMTLRECIQFALNNHASNSIYDNEIMAAKEKTREALAGYLPQLNSNIAFDDNLKRQVSVIPAGAFSPKEIRIKFGNQYNINASAQIDQVIFDKSMLVGIKAAEPNNQVSVLKKEQNQDNLIYNITGAYFQVLIYLEQGKILKENEKKYRELLDILKLRLDKGVIKKTDFDRTRVSLNNILSQKSILQANKEVAINKLKNAIGIPLSEELDVAEMTNYESLASLPDENIADITNLLDYKIQRNNILLQEFDVKRKQVAFLPTVSAYARYGGMAFGNEFNKAIKTWVDYSAIGLKANIPIFSGYRKNSQLKQAELSLLNAKSNLKINTNMMDMQLQNSSTQLQKSSSDLAINRENLNLAKEVFENSTLEYERGVATLSDLLNSDYSYKEAQSNYVTSLISSLSSRLEYEKSKGTLKSYINQF